MKRSVAGVTAMALLLSGCTSSLKPVTLSVPPEDGRQKMQFCPTVDKNTPANTSPTSKQRLQWMVCELHARAVANLNQAQSWENRTEWRDIPLIGAATVVAGLLLFGKRDDNKALKPGVQDAVTGVGFGVAALATFANYLSPQKARDLLRQGARGHFCIATQGELILTVWDAVDRSTESDRLTSDLAELTRLIATNPNGFGKIDATRAIQAQAIKALALYNLQVQERDSAGIVINETTWNFGIDLMTKTDRSEPDVEALVKSITDQARSATKFDATGASATDPAAPAAVRALVAGAPRAAVRTPDELSDDVATDTNALIANLPNIEALVLGFDKCAATALAGGTARAEHIQRVSLQ